jgi:hypothetical protein
MGPQTILLICSGVGGFAGSLPAERVARGGVDGLSAMVELWNVVDAIDLEGLRYSKVFSTVLQYVHRVSVCVCEGVVLRVGVLRECRGGLASAVMMYAKRSSRRLEPLQIAHCGYNSEDLKRISHVTEEQSASLTFLAPSSERAASASTTLTNPL